MADAGRRSPLADLQAELAAMSAADRVTLREMPPAVQIDLRGDPDDPRFGEAVRELIGVALPARPNSFETQGAFAALWLGPDEWLIVAPEADHPDLARRLRRALAGLHAAVVDVSASRTILELAGPKARELLLKGCPLDLHPRSFGPGRCAQSLLAKAQVLIQQTDETPTYRLYVRPSYAHYVAAWLMDAMREYRGAGAA